MVTARVKPLQARAQRTRAKLLAAAAGEFSERGYAAATTKSIAERAQVATGSFYQYFENKDVALRELARERFAQVDARAIAALPTPGPDDASKEIRRALQAIVALVVALHREDPGLHEVLTERRHLDDELDRLTSEYERNLVARIVAWLETWGVDGDLQAQAFVLFCTLEGSVHSHVLGQAMVSDTRFTAALVEALARMVGSSAVETQAGAPQGGRR